MIDKFSKDRFEAALPIHKMDNYPLWHDVGFENGEFVYGIDLHKDGIGAPWVTIVIRSSVAMDGFARNTGEDSIRIFFLRNGKPHGSKLSCYVTRVKGWEERLTKQLRIMYKRGMNLKVCPLCEGPKAIFKRKSYKGEDGKLFQACPIHFNVTYENYEE